MAIFRKRVIPVLCIIAMLFGIPISVNAESSRNQVEVLWSADGKGYTLATVELVGYIDPDFVYSEEFVAFYNDEWDVDEYGEKSFGEEIEFGTEQYWNALSLVEDEWGTIPELILITVDPAAKYVKLKNDYDIWNNCLETFLDVETSVVPESEDGYYVIDFSSPTVEDTEFEELLSSWENNENIAVIYCDESNRIPTENVCGEWLVLGNSEEEQASNIVIIQKATSPFETVDKSELFKLINLVSVGTGNYYTSGDRYNGKDYIEDKSSGFWKQLVAEDGALRTAEQVYYKDDATEREVSEATTNLSAAIAKLIPIEQLNATALYEAVQAEKERDVNEAFFSDTSLAVYKAAKYSAENYLNSLFKEGMATSENVATNQTAADNYAYELKSASNALDSIAESRDVLNAQMAYDSLNALLNKLFHPSVLDENRYTAESWDAFLSKRETALAFMGAHERPESGIGYHESESYVTAYASFWDACYKGLTANVAGTAEVHVIDHYSGISDRAIPKHYHGTYKIDVPAGGISLAQILKSVLPDGYNSGDILNSGMVNGGIGVYVNGIYLFKMPESKAYTANPSTHRNAYTFQPLWDDAAGQYILEGIDDSIRVNAGDTIVVALMSLPTEVNASGSVGPKPASEVLSTVQFTEIQQNKAYVGIIDATSGEKINLSVIYRLAMPAGYNGGALPKSGAKVFISPAYANEEEVRSAEPSMDTEIVTAADGSFTLQLYSEENSDEAWYLLNVLDYGTDGGLSNGANVIIHVKDSADLSELKNDLKNKLNEVRNAHGDEFYNTAQLEQINIAYSEGMSGIEAAITSGEANAAFEAAYETILSIQEYNKNAVSYHLNALRWTLPYLPDIAELQDGKLYEADRPVLDFLFDEEIGIYSTQFSDYEKTQLTSNELALMEALQETYNDGHLPETPSMTFTCDFVDEKTGEEWTQPVKKISIQAFLGKKVGWSEGENWWESIPIWPWNSWIPDSRVDFSVDNETTLSANGFTGISLRVSLVDSLSEVEDLEYTITKIEDNLASRYNSNSYVEEGYVATWSLEAFPRQNTKIRIYLKNKDDADPAEPYLAELKTAFNTYQRSDYSTENWEQLLAVYNAGEAAIRAATSDTEMAETLAAALAEMERIEKLNGSGGEAIPGWGSGSVFDAGKQVGTVVLTVENTTYPAGAFYNGGNPLFEKLAYPIGENDTMMTVILRALSDEGYSWDDGSNSGFGISYIANVSKNGRSMGQFSGEPGSGWMGSLNDYLVNEGFPGFSVANGQLANGDEIRFMYTQNLGVDLGGSWGDSNTTLKSLETSTGMIVPTFSSGEEGGSYDFALLIPSKNVRVKLTPTASNKNYLVKTFLNEKVTSNVEGNSFYKRTEYIPTRTGDIIYIGVGENAWPSMNKVGAEARVYSPTWYALHVISADDGADYVNELIAALPAANKINSSNYEATKEQISTIDAVIAVLNASEQEKVNTTTLETVREVVEGFEAVMALKAEIAALPGSVTLTDRDAVETAKAHYDALTAAQKNLLTVAETNKLLKAVNTLAVLDALAAIGNTKDFASTEANTQAAVKTALEAWLNNANAAVVVDRFTAAMDGTAENLSGTAGSYSATVTVTIGSGAVAASGEKTVTGSISPVVYVKSSDTGVQSIKVNGVPATGVGTAYAAVLPYGSDMATASFEIVPADKATASVPETNDDGETWTFTVTAEDGTTAEYTVTLSVNSVVVTVLECGIYTVTPDVTVTELSPAAVSGLLEAVSTDALDLPQGTESVALWLSVTATAKDGEDITLRIEPIYAVDGAEGQAVPAAALIGQITVTLPIPGTEYSKVLAAGEYLDAEGTESGITFTITAAGEYSLIPDANIAAVTWHLNGGTSAVVTDGQKTIYFRSDDGADLPEAEKTGFTFKGWHSEDSIDSVAYIAVSAQLPADLYAVWQSGNVNAAVTVSGVSAVKSGSVYTVTLPYGSDYPKAADISITPEDAAATYTKPMTGDDGASWSFTVTAEDGTKQEYNLQVVIAEQTVEDILAAAKETIEGADWNTEQQTANDAASLKAFVENKLAALDLGAAYTVTVTSVTPAVAGDAEDTQGAAGSYSFTVTLTAGEASETAAGSGSISATAYVAPAQQADYITALNAVLPYLRSTVTNPIVGSTYGEWAVLALNRGDAATEAWNNIYLSNLKAYVDQKNGVLAEKNYTEYSRVILALTSMGVDATKFATESGTYDLVKPLLDKQASGEYWAEWQGNNGTAFALLAADSHDYLDTAEGKALRAGLIASLKANQMASGAWAISGTSSPDLDVTAAAIYALAPYYLDSSRLSALGGTVSYAEVQAMVDSALAYLSGQQNADGGFGSVEADVWAIIALSTLGRDADTDPAFVKNGKSLLADMLSYQDKSSGAFRHLLSGSVDQMATEEAAYGLVAYDRFKNSRNTLYDMSDVEIASLDEKANKAAAEEVEALIDAIGEVTLESKAKIDAARAAYDALTDEQKALVGNLQTLKDAEAKYQELAEAADQEEIDKAAAKGVDELIDAIGEVTLDSEKAIKAARNAYDALTDEQKKLVEKLADLEAAEAKLEELQPLVTVTFYLQSGKSSEVAEGETKTYTKADEGKALPTASRDNYSFDGWYDAAVDGTRYTSVSAALPRELYAQWTSDSSGDSGSGGGGDSDEGKITVTMRLIGAKQAEKDVDLGAEEYMPDYVTWIATTSYKLEEGSSVYDLWLQATGDAGIRSVGAEKNYVSAVFAPSSLGGYELAEFTNGKRSGWMYTINGRHPGFGLKEQELHDGDRVIWHYVNDYSYEVSDWFEADSRWPSLGDGRYYNRWLKAPDRFGGSGGGLGEGAQSSGGSGDSSGGSSEIIPSYDGDTIVIKADVEHSEGGAAYAADATLDKKTVAEGLEKAEDKSSLKVWVDIEDSNRLVLQIEPEAMKEIADAKAGLRMECSRGVIKLDADAVAKLTESGHEVRMVVSYDDWNDKTTVSVRPFPPTDGDAAVMLKIELPATKDGQALSIVGSDGTTTPIKKSAIIGDRVYAEVPSGVTLTITESNRYWNDVKAGDWFADAVSFAVSHDLMNGVDRYEFAPNMPMTRAMLVTVLYRLEDEPEIAGSMSFADVASGAWYTEAMAWAAEQEIVRGNGDGFAPNDNITREQIATVLYRYAQYLGMDVEAKGDVSKFSDGEKISSWAQDAMAWAVKVGLFKGDDTGSLNPQGNATRAEVATLLERLIKLIVVS